MKRLPAMLLASVIAFTGVGGLVACGDGGPVLKVWAPQQALGAYRELAKQFLQEHPEYSKYKIKFDATDEKDVETKMGKDPSVGATVFFFPSDHLYKFYNRGVLQALPEEYAEEVRNRDEPDTYEFGTITNDDGEEEIVGFPATNDNGYFLYYDSELLTEDDVKSLDTIQDKARENEMSVAFAYDDVYYSASFFIGTGCTFGYTDYTLKKYTTNLDSSKGEAAVKAYLKYFGKARNEFTKVVNGKATTKKVINNGALSAGFADGSYIAGVAGTWEWANIKNAMENKKKGSSAKIKTAILPQFTVDGDSNTYYMGSFYGPKFCGVNKKKKDVEEIKAGLALANYFTDMNGQLERYKATFSGPSNIYAYDDEDVAADERLETYKKQKEHGIPQHDQSGNFWSPSGFGNLMKKLATGNVTTLENAIQLLKAQAKSLEK